MRNIYLTVNAISQTVAEIMLNYKGMEIFYKAVKILNHCLRRFDFVVE